MGEVLFDRDWRFIIDSIYRINTTRTVDELEHGALECLLTLIPCTQGTFFIVDEGARGSNLSFGRPVCAGQPARFFKEFIEGNYAKDPYFSGTGAINKTEVFKDSDLMPEEYRMRTKLYQDIYAKQGIHHGLRAYLVHNGETIGNISMFNAREKGDFTDKDVTVLNALAPHIALKLYELLGAEREMGGVKPLKSVEHFGLTAREAEVVAQALSGLTDQQISSKLNVSLSTVKKHLHNAYRKAHVGSRAQLAALMRK